MGRIPVTNPADRAGDPEEMEISSAVFPERLKLLRLTRKLSQADVARAVGVTPASVSAWENRRQEPDMEKLVKLARFFGTSVDYLTGASNNPRPAALPEWLDKLPEDLQFRLSVEGGEALIPLFRASVRALDEMSPEALRTLIDSLIESKRIHDEYVRRRRGGEPGTNA